VGREETIHGLNTYVVGNRTNPRGIIVVYSDIFGLKLLNNKLIADAYAKGGEWLVYLPDFFKGDPVSLKFADVAIPVDRANQSKLSFFTGMLASAGPLVMWFQRHKTGPTSKTCNDFLEALRRETDKKVGIVGMCWGGRYALRAGRAQHFIELNGEKKPLVDAVVALHPSNLSLPEDVWDLAVPSSIGWGFEDKSTKIILKDIVAEICLRNKKQDKGFMLEHKVYKPGRHGFSVRGNPDDPQERKCLEDSVTQVLEWFDRFL
jgi:dienelactone hydrolase